MLTHAQYLNERVIKIEFETEKTKMPKARHNRERISTTIPHQLAAEARAKGLQFSYALSWGLRRLLGHETRTTEAEMETDRRIQKLQAVVSELSTRLWREQERVAELLNSR